MRDPNCIPAPPPRTLLPHSHNPSPPIPPAPRHTYPASPPQIPIKILTHNIRYATTSPFPGELPWPSRLPGLLSQLKYHTRHHPGSIICLQEVLHKQLQDILQGLNSSGNGNGDTGNTSPPPPQLARAYDEEDENEDESTTTEPAGEEEWTYYGRGRDDGQEKGEYSPIFFRRGVWERVCAKTIWLSATPEVPGSKGWDAASVRICGVVGLEYRGAGGAGGGTRDSDMGMGRRRIVILNTHLDDQGRRSRVEGARMILQEIREWRRRCHGNGRGGVDGVVLAGDLNSEDPSEVPSFSCGSRSSSSSSRRRRAEIDDNKGGLVFSSSSPSSPSSSSAGDERGEKPRPLGEECAIDEALSEEWEEAHHDEEVQDPPSEEADAEKEDAYTIFNAPHSGLRDLRSFIPAPERYGHEMTFTGFDGRGDGDGGVGRCTRIDFIHVGVDAGTDGYEGDGDDGYGDGDGDGDGFGGAGRERRGEREGKSDDDDRARVSLGKKRSGMGEEEEEKEKTPWQIEGYTVLPNLFDDGVYISDHRAVVGELVLK